MIKWNSAYFSVAQITCSCLFLFEVTRVISEPMQIYNSATVYLLIYHCKFPLSKHSFSHIAKEQYCFLFSSGNIRHNLFWSSSEWWRSFVFIIFDWNCIMLVLSLETKIEGTELEILNLYQVNMYSHSKTQSFLLMTLERK